MSNHRWIAGGIAITSGILLVVAFGLVTLYEASSKRLDDALGQRLGGIATTATQLVDPAEVADWSLDPAEPIELVWLATRFEAIRRANDLGELSLCDATGFVLISASGRMDRGELNDFWDLDRAAVDLALSGFPSTSALYRSGALYQKSAHAPVLDDEGQVVAIVSAEAAVDFFDTLATLRDVAWTTAAIVLGFLLVSAFALARLLRARMRDRATLLEQENLAAMGRMTAGIAHEIRNPLGVIRGTGQHLERRLQQVGIDDPAAGFITEEVDRLDRILTGYLSFGAGRTTDPERFDLAEVVERTVRIMADQLTPATVATSVGELPVEGDRQRLQQVLINLLLNARDAMPGGGTIEIVGERSGARIVLRVKDEGEGLGTSNPESLFTAFETKKEKGSGLGLAVSRQIAEAHGGTLVLASRTDRAGAVATLTLPAAGA